MNARDDRGVPLPNEHLKAGDLCPRSFARYVENHVYNIGVDGWGTCIDCGEVVNTSRGEIPRHVIPKPLTDQEWSDFATALEIEP